MNEALQAKVGDHIISIHTSGALSLSLVNGDSCRALYAYEPAGFAHVRKSFAQFAEWREMPPARSTLGNRELTLFSPT